MSLQPSREHLFQGELQPMGGALLGILAASGGWEGNASNRAAFPAWRKSQQKVLVIVSGVDARRHSC